ncbi:hypothetical protein [Streptomyces sp. CRN 30]
MVLRALRLLGAVPVATGTVTGAYRRTWYGSSRC